MTIENKSNSANDGVDERIDCLLSDAHSADLGLNLLVESYWEQLYRKARFLTRCDADAHDCVQEACLAAYQGWMSIRSTCARTFKAWLSRVLFNKCKDLYGSARHSRDGPFDVDEHDRAVEEKDPISSMEDRESYEILLATITTCLTDLEREAFLGFSLYELSYRDLAEDQNTSVQAITARIHRARVKLVAALSPKLLIHFPELA